VKIDFRTYPCQPPDITREHVAYALSLGLPFGRAGSGALAVVGRGVSILDHIKTLRNWPSDVWAINGAAQWCRDRGIRATLFSLDPETHLIPLCDGIEEAFLSVHCNPRAFDRLIGQGSKVSLFHEGPERNLPTGTTTATSAVGLAIANGFSSVVYFGCEGTMTPPHPEYPQWFNVRVAGELHRTKADLLIQSKLIAEMICEFPFFVSERSGGLLNALCRELDWDVECVSPAMAAAMTGADGRIPLCEEGGSVC
jgi:hypothetical protein